jgi:hypothetical protein
MIRSIWKKEDGDEIVPVRSILEQQLVATDAELKQGKAEYKREYYQRNKDKLSAKWRENHVPTAREIEAEKLRAIAKQWDLAKSQSKLEVTLAE